MRKVLMMVVAALVLMGTAFTTKAASLLKSSNVSIGQNKGNSLVLKHANQLFGNSVMAKPDHSSHASHESHASHYSSS